MLSQASLGYLCVCMWSLGVWLERASERASERERENQIERRGTLGRTQLGQSGNHGDQGS